MQRFQHSPCSMFSRRKPVDLGKVWEELAKTMGAVLTAERVEKASWNDRFTDIYALCTAPALHSGAALYNQVKRFLQGHARGVRGCMLQSGEELLAAYSRRWEEYSRGAGALDCLFRHLNKHFVKKNRETADFRSDFDIEIEGPLLEVGELALSMWQAFVIEPLEDELLDTLLREIRNYRGGVEPRREALRSAIDSFVQAGRAGQFPLKLYEEIFESPFLTETRAYYHRAMCGLLAEWNWPAYLRTVAVRLGHEDFLCENYLPRSSRPKVLRELKEQMITGYLPSLLAACPSIIQQENRDDIANLYYILSAVSAGLPEMAQALQSHIRDQVLRVTSGPAQQSSPAQVVESAVALYGKFFWLNRVSLHADPPFMIALDNAFGEAINHAEPGSVCRAPRVLAKYLDSLLRRSGQALTDKEVEVKLLNAMFFFKYIEDKDLFQKFYARLLARRLLRGLSRSLTAEESMVYQLTCACGHELTRPLRQMCADARTSAALNAQFQYFVKSQDPAAGLGLSFQVRVLRAGSWPLPRAPQAALALPPELEASARAFTWFYGRCYSGRRLTWLHHLCAADVQMNHLSRPYVAVLTTYQTAALLAFSSGAALSYTALRAGAGLGEPELSRAVASLLEAGVLLRRPQGAALAESCFSLNPDFRSPTRRFKVTSTAREERAPDAERRAEGEDCGLFLQAAIVRVMKARGVVRHAELVREVTSQAGARFRPSVRAIKECIEVLIDRAYLRRSATAADEYTYLP